jgi:NAD(P)-dependent dehydrogenase (short-subunit alcohol dehydrogenase family)
MSERRVVVTGASSGIGYTCAASLAKRGWRVLAGVRNLRDGEAIRAADPQRIRPLILDVTDPGAIAAAAAVVGAEPLAGLVNCAGVAAIGPLELVAPEALRGQFDVNVVGLMAVIQAFLPALRRGPGRIVTIGSIAGRSALPGTGAYDASKFAIEGLTDSLRMELQPFGIQVSLIEPGAVVSAIWHKTFRELERLRQNSDPARYALYEGLLARVSQETARSMRQAVPASAVAKAVEHALTAARPKTRYLVGRDAWFWLLLNMLPDRLRDRLILAGNQHAGPAALRAGQPERRSP